MKEILKNKAVLMFMAVVIGVTYLSTSYEVKLEKEVDKLNEQQIIMSIR